MEGYFEVDDLKKSEVQKRYIRKSKVARAISGVFLAEFLAFTIVFAIYGLGLKDTFIIQDVTTTDYGRKNLLLVWTILVIVDLIILVSWFTVKMIVNSILGRYIMQRLNESLMITDDIIEYRYLKVEGLTFSDRIIVQIPVDSIKKIKINRDISKVELFEVRSSEFYENSSQKKTQAPENDEEGSSYVFFDYFEPGLIEFFEQKYGDRLVME